MLGAEALAQWVLADQRFQFAHDGAVAAEREVGLEPRFERGHAELLEPRALGLCERLGGELGQRRPAPERQRLAEPVGRLAGRALRPAPRAPPPRRSRTGGGRVRPARAGGSSPAGACAMSPAPASCAASRRRSAPSSARSRARSSPQRSSMIRSIDTVRLALTKRSAKNARCFPPPSGSSRSPSRTSSGPRIRKSIARLGDDANTGRACIYRPVTSRLPRDSPAPVSLHGHLVHRTKGDRDDEA